MREACRKICLSSKNADRTRLPAASNAARQPHRKARKRTHGHQKRPLDSPAGNRPPDDRPLQREAGLRGRHLLRTLLLRLRPPCLRRVQNLHQRQLRHHRSQGLRRAFLCLGAGSQRHHSAQLLRPRPLRRVLQDSPRRAHHLRRQIHLRAMSLRSSRNGRALSPWKSPTPRLCPRASMPTRASARSSSSSPTPTMCARSAMPTAKESTRTSKGSYFPSYRSRLRVP